MSHPSACPASGEIPQYNGNCTGCAGQGGANKYYCATTDTCWQDSSCGDQCGQGECIGNPSSCPPPGTVPAYAGNCTGCTSSSGGNAYYCADTNQRWCWPNQGCGDSCVDCVAYPRNCPPAGEIPQYNNNCTFCAGSRGANKYYCADSDANTCWETGSCGGNCTKCIVSANSCPSRGEVPQYDGNCSACTAVGNDWYCGLTNTCWDSANCGMQCGDGQLCVAFAKDCAPPGTLPGYAGNCTGCTSASGANKWFCTSSNLCYASSGCGGCSPCDGASDDCPSTQSHKDVVVQPAQKQMPANPKGLPERRRRL